MLIRFPSAPAEVTHVLTGPLQSGSGDGVTVLPPVGGL
ncbi:hypothetical protein TI01_0703 [Lysobacter sp. A03]|nr:hypothetical protein TI01_0703 [Lysobacter sp. A03]